MNTLLNSLSKVITDEENEELTKMITEDELFHILKKATQNKSPGEDGLTSEFYLSYWNIMKSDLVEVQNCMMINKILSNSQRNGIVTLFHKGGDKCVLDNWRPITLLCVDYKIFTRIIVSRLKPLLNKFISVEQYCSVEGKSINECNIMLRDLINYVIDNDIDCGMINIDFKQAFDRVDVNFVFLTLKAVGFSDSFIDCIKMLYTGITSKLKINNNIGDSFPILRGVRQGCPLSMILFIISQESLYRIIKKSNSIKPISLPNQINVKVLGYADDTNAFICREMDLGSLHEIIKMFCKATGAEINTNKTKIMGFGNWKGKMNWTANWVTPEKTSLKCLGIKYYNNWDDTAKNNWLIIENKINSHVRCLSNRQLTIFQKSIYINAVVLAKMSYIANIIPLDKDIAKIIISSLFTYIWNGKYNPIKREYMYLPKLRGGIGLNNIQTKCNSLLLKNFLRTYTKDHHFTNFMAYYCESRLSAILPKNVNDFTFRIPSYYQHTLDLCRIIMSLQDFPNVKCKLIYEILSKETRPKIEENFPLYNWNNIWRNVNCKYLDKYDRVVSFKFLYNVLPSKKKLHDMKVIGFDDPMCTLCNVPETNFHMFYFCSKVKSLYRFISELCERVCGFKISNHLSFIYFDIKTTKAKAEICSIVLSTYLGIVWSYRNDGQLNLKKAFIEKIQYNVKTIMLCKQFRDMHKDLLIKLENEICSLT